MAKPRMTKAQIDELREDYLAGLMRWKDLTEKWGVSQTTIAKYVADLHRPDRTRALRLQMAQDRMDKAEAAQRLRDDNSRLRSNNKRLLRRINELETELAILQDKNNYLNVQLRE